MVTSESTVRQGHLSLTLFIVSVAFACAEPKSDGATRALVDSTPETPGSVRLTTRCYRSSHSMLLGPITKSRQNGEGPGWLRVDGLPTADGGSGEIVDANRAGLGGVWHRGTGDSLSITAADDFLRVELRLAVSDSTATGSALALSDADLERDASGKLQTFRRSWVLRASRAPCDSMPVRVM